MGLVSHQRCDEPIGYPDRPGFRAVEQHSSRRPSYAGTTWPASLARRIPALTSTATAMFNGNTARHSDRDVIRGSSSHITLSERGNNVDAWRLANHGSHAGTPRT